MKQVSNNDRVIKLSKRRITEENLRKKKATKSSEQKAQLSIIFEKKPYLWSKAEIKEAA